MSDASLPAKVTCPWAFGASADSASVQGEWRSGATSSISLLFLGSVPEQAAQLNLRSDTQAVCHSCLNARIQSKHFSLEVEGKKWSQRKESWRSHVRTSSVLPYLTMSLIYRRLLQTGEYFLPTYLSDEAIRFSLSSWGLLFVCLNVSPVKFMSICWVKQL